MIKANIKLSRMIGLLIVLVMFILIAVLHYTSNDDAIKIRSLEIGRDFGIAFLTVVASKKLGGIVNINKGGKK